MKHTIINPIAALLLLAVGLAGCSKEGTDTLDTWNGEIRLGSEIASQVKTRAAATDVPDRQIASDKVVLFFVDDAGASVAKKNLYESYAMTANGSGGFTKYNPSAEDMYFPATGNGVDIYAFLTYGFVSVKFPSSAITREVKSDQSTQYGANYLDSDLLYAANKAVARTSDDVNLTFYHMLSKVEVALKAGVGLEASDLTGAVVTIENTQLKADFLPDKAKDINDPSTGQDTRAAMVTLTANNNPITPITVGTSIEPDAFDDATTYASAVVVPQTVAQNKRFIKVTLANGGELYYTIPDMGGLELESGNKYQFRITVNLTELTVKSTIADWATGTPIDGTAELPPPIGSKTDPATAAVGDFYFSDGTLEASTATLTLQQQAACIGIVFYKSVDGKGGKVVGLTQATNTEWSMEKVQTYSNSLTDGRANMETIAQYIIANGKSWDAYPAFKWVAQQNGKPGGGWDATTDRWYLPAKEELQALYGAYNDDVKVAVNRSLNKISSAAQLSANPYWSSSENAYNPADNARIVNFNDGNVGYGSKGNDGNVRGVFAF